MIPHSQSRFDTSSETKKTGSFDAHSLSSWSSSEGLQTLYCITRSSSIRCAHLGFFCWFTAGVSNLRWDRPIVPNRAAGAHCCALHIWSEFADTAPFGFNSAPRTNPPNCQRADLDAPERNEGLQVVRRNHGFRSTFGSLLIVSEPADVPRPQ